MANKIQISSLAARVIHTRSAQREYKDKISGLQQIKWYERPLTEPETAKLANYTEELRNLQGIETGITVALELLGISERVQAEVDSHYLNQSPY